MKRLLLAAGFLLAATSASMAQGYVYGEPYRYGTYDYARVMGSVRLGAGLWRIQRFAGI